MMKHNPAVGTSVRALRLFRRPGRSGPAANAGIRRHAVGVAGLVFVTLVVLVAAFAPKVAPFNPLVADLDARLRPPFWYPHAIPGRLLGTDQLGRDLLSRIIFGARVSLL